MHKDPIVNNNITEFIIFIDGQFIKNSFRNKEQFQNNLKTEINNTPKQKRSTENERKRVESCQKVMRIKKGRMK